MCFKVEFYQELYSGNTWGRRLVRINIFCYVYMSKSVEVFLVLLSSPLQMHIQTQVHKNLCSQIHWKKPSMLILVILGFVFSCNLLGLTCWSVWTTASNSIPSTRGVSIAPRKGSRKPLRNDNLSSGEISFIILIHVLVSGGTMPMSSRRHVYVRCSSRTWRLG